MELTFALTSLSVPKILGLIKKKNRGGRLHFQQVISLLHFSLPACDTFL